MTSLTQMSLICEIQNKKEAALPLETTMSDQMRYNIEFQALSNNAFLPKR